MKQRRLSNLQSLACFFVVVILLALSAYDVTAQDCSDLGNPPTPRMTGSSCRMYGQVKLEILQTPTLSSATIRALIQGESGDFVARPNIIVRADVLAFSLLLQAPNNFIPDEVLIDITSYSPRPFKYAKNKDLTIFVDGVEIINENMELLSSNAIADRLLLRMKYSDLLVLGSAQNISLKVGSTSIELSTDVVRALQALTEFTKQLKPPPPRIQQSCV